MNNDLKKLSVNEIRIRQNDLIEAESLIKTILHEKRGEYNKKIQRRWTNPVNILSLNRQIKELEKAVYLLNEYSRTLTDESNSRM
jgi:hypothetical protein